MSADAIVGLCVGGTVLLGVAWRLLRAGHRIANVGERLIERVGALEDTVNNGMRSDIHATREEAKRAQLLAADAARAATVADQHAVEGREEIGRAVNALRSEVDIYTNVVLSDRHRIREALRELGHDIGDDDEGAL